MIEYRPLRFDRRGEIIELLRACPPDDALVAYYACEYDPDKLRGFGKYDDLKLVGFLLVSQTGWDLFRPLIIPFQLSAEDIEPTLQEALAPHRPYLVHLPTTLQAAFLKNGDLSDQRLTELYLFSDPQPDPAINVLATRSETTQGWPRYEIDSRAGGFAAVGTNWRGSDSAELYLEADARGVKRGFVRAVLLAIVRESVFANRKLYLRLEQAGTLASSTFRSIGFRALDVQVIQAGFQLRSGERIKEDTPT